jgi:NADPH:quinone reductase-like Zn-dependent oxidoreductase
VRALTISAHGTLDQLEYREDLPIPTVDSPTDVRVRVAAGALNHLDLFVISGLPGVTIVPPWIMGGDGAGTVDTIGEDVTNVRVGDRVILNPGISDRTCAFCREGDHPLCLKYGILGEHHLGTLAEYIVVPSANVHVVPADTDMIAAAAFPLATLTAWRMVVSRARVGPGDDVLIWGIGGGVALAALQIAKLRGARVWVTSGSDEKLERARLLGADETINHATEDVPKIIRARTAKRGVNVVIDNVGEATWARSLAALGKRGRLVTCGGTSGPMLQTDVRRLFWNQLTIMGSTMGNDDEFVAMTEEFRRGRLVPPVDSVHDLRDGRAAFERLASASQFGKIVIRIGP